MLGPALKRQPVAPGAGSYGLRGLCELGSHRPWIGPGAVLFCCCNRAWEYNRRGLTERHNLTCGSHLRVVLMLWPTFVHLNETFIPNSSFYKHLSYFPPRPTFLSSTEKNTLVTVLSFSLSDIIIVVIINLTLSVHHLGHVRHLFGDV